jgi:hypothetical protein
LVGAGAAAALLFPRSLLTPGLALPILTLFLLLAPPIALAVRRGRAPAAAGRARLSGGKDTGWGSRSLAVFFIGATVAASVSFALLNLRSPLLWDGFQIWATKAMVLSHEGGLRPELWPASEFYGRIGRVVRYPQLVPMDLALLASLRGGFAFEALKPAFLVFFVSMLLSSYRAAKACLPQPSAFSVPMLAACLPLMATGESAGGYADLPQAAYAVAVVAACFANRAHGRGTRSPLPWLLGSLPLVKSEGMILLVIACVMIVGVQAVRGFAAVVSLVRRHWQGIAVVGVMLALRLGYLRWAHYPDAEFSIGSSASFARALARVPRVSSLCFSRLTDFSHWGLFWLAFLLAMAVLVLRGTASESALAMAAALALVAYSSVFLFTNWSPVELHLNNASDRLALQLAPPSCLVIAMGFERWRSHAGTNGRNGRPARKSTIRSAAHPSP